MSKKKKTRYPVKRPIAGTQTNQKQITRLTQQQFSGPIPHPEILHRYDQILPGAAECILSMAEEDAKHQREIENNALEFASKEVKKGQQYGLAIGTLAFLTCIIVLWFGSEKTAMVLGGSTVLGLVTVFVVGRFAKNK
jgi:uncharacterized membrane protein